jgi:hypothetical protein
MTLRCLVVKVQGVAYSTVMGKGPLRMLGTYTDPPAHLLCCTAAAGSHAALPLSQRRTPCRATLLRIFGAAEASLEAPEQLAVNAAGAPVGQAACRPTLAPQRSWGGGGVQLAFPQGCEEGWRLRRW